MNIMKYVFNFRTVESETLMPAFQISISGQKNVSVGKKHNKYFISPINSWKLPAVEIFFDMNFSGNNLASYIKQGYNNSETHSTGEAKTV
jgi:hypothetical protein